MLALFGGSAVCESTDAAELVKEINIIHQYVLTEHNSYTIVAFMRASQRPLIGDFIQPSVSLSNCWLFV